ncbi:MAG TPA: hypothetical protein VIY28_15940 [Pseudonocardiaceae bacterium]
MWSKGWIATADHSCSGRWAKAQGYRWYDFGGLPELVLRDMVDLGIRHNAE